MTFEGVYTAIITPFLSNGALDEEGLIQLIDRQISANINGIVVLGTTGEAPTLTPQEKRRIIQLARERIRSPVQLLAGTGSYATSTTIEETKKAEEWGVDGALVVTPYYNKPTQEGLFLHYQALAKATSLPILIYNIQGRTGQNLQTSILKKLAEIPSIVAVKEAAGNMIQMMEVIEMAAQCPYDFKVLSGDDNLTLPLMAIGGHGIISVVSNLVPELILELYHKCLANEWDLARQLHYLLLPLFRGAFIETNPIPIKTLLQFDGLPSGPCRLPLSFLTAENEKKLRHLHETIKLPLLTHG
jgi:4-hydroxy-tetrahydrodipicolinate synthase